MTSEIKASAPLYPDPQAVPVNDENIVIEGLVLDVDPTPADYTAAKIQKISLYIFAAICVLGGVALIGLSVTGIIPGPCVYLSIPLFCLAIASVCVAMQILDYEDPVELDAMRCEAPLLTYRQLRSKHGLQNVLNHDILPLDQLGEKFFVHIHGMNFRSFNRDSAAEDLESLQFHGILSAEELTLLKGLKIRLEDEQENLREINLALDGKYPHRLNQQCAALRLEEEKARSAYDKEVRSYVDQWNVAAQKEIDKIPRNKKDYEQSVEKIRVAYEKKKTSAAVFVTAREKKILDCALLNIQSRRDALFQDQVACEQQDLYNQELGTARGEKNTALAAIDTAFSAWLSKLR